MLKSNKIIFTNAPLFMSITSADTSPVTRREEDTRRGHKTACSSTSVYSPCRMILNGSGPPLGPAWSSQARAPEVVRVCVSVCTYVCVYVRVFACLRMKPTVTNKQNDEGKFNKTSGNGSRMAASGACSS